jgi:hypothetical protein
MGYIIKQTHDHSKIRDASYGGVQGWIDFIIPKLDLEKSFGEGADEALAREILDKIGGEIEEFIGSGGYSYRGKKRTMEFKDGEAFYEYYMKYGYGDNFFQSYMRQIDLTANRVALTELLGVNHKQGFEDLKGIINSMARASDGVDQLNSNQIARLDNQYNRLVGKADRPGFQESKVYKLEQIVSPLIRMVSLGMSQLSQFHDIVTIAVKHNSALGQSTWGAYGSAVSTYLEKAATSFTKNGEARLKTLSDHLNVALGKEYEVLFEKYKIMNSELRMNDDTFVGKMTNIAHTMSDHFMNFAGIKYMGKMGKATASELVMRHLGDVMQRIRDKGAGDLSKAELNMLNNMDLSPEDMVKAYKYMDPTEDIPFSLLNLHRHMENTKDLELKRIHNNLANYVTEFYRTASPESSPRIQNALYTDLPKDDPLGVAMRFLWMFRGPLWGVTRNSIEHMRMHQTVGNNPLIPLASLMSIGAMNGFMVDLLKDGVRGKLGETDWSDSAAVAKRVHDGLASSGVLGMPYEMFLGRHLDRGNSFIESAMGPVYGKVSYQVYNAHKLMRGDLTTEDAVKVIGKLTPGQNLLYYQAMKSMFLNVDDGIMEMFK